MRVLLDTHAFLWFVLGDAQLSANARTIIEDRGNEKLLSPASYWEIAIKISLGKYTLSAPYEAFMDKGITDNGFVVVPIIAQAMIEEATIISIDTVFDAYPISRRW